jgi:DHA1 family bicyclomycin/chloramphenicol resistance-like MFS transporter
MAYALAMTLLFGVFSSYLGSSQLIIDDVFGLDDMFPIIFGGLAVLMGIANLANASIVERIGAGRIVEWVTTAYVAAGAGFVAVSAASGGSPGFWSYTALLAVLLMMNSLLVPNLSTLAMDPMGAVAGTASGIIGTLQIGGGALLGSLIDRAYDNTVTPLAVGFLAAGVLSWLVVRWAARRP